MRPKEPIKVGDAWLALLPGQAIDPWPVQVVGTYPGHDVYITRRRLGGVLGEEIVLKAERFVRRITDELPQ